MQCICKTNQNTVFSQIDERDHTFTRLFVRPFVRKSVQPYILSCQNKYKIMSHERCLNVASTLFACRHQKQMATLFVLYLCNMLTLMSVSLTYDKQVFCKNNRQICLIFAERILQTLFPSKVFCLASVVYLENIIILFSTIPDRSGANTRQIMFVPRWRQIFDRKTSISDFNSQHVVIFLGQQLAAAQLQVLEFSGTFGHYVRTLHVNVIVCRDDCYRIKVLTVSFKFGCSQ